MGNRVCILGADVGFASFGVGVVGLHNHGEDVLDVQVVQTEKSKRKKNVRAADDKFSRAQVIAEALHGLVERWRPVAIAAEAMSDPPNASTAGMMMMAWGVLADVAYVYRLPAVQATPQEIKKCLCGSKIATKEDVRKALEVRYPGQFDDFKGRFPARKPPKPNGQWEHGFDAVGAVVSCLDTDVIRLARAMIR